jgi:hypothetical protein
LARKKRQAPVNAAAPRIQSPEGEPVHDIHAARITREMLVFLETENKRLWTGTVDALRTQQMGNPVGQRRAVERFKRAAGPLALDIRLKPGKRGHCELTVAAWTIWDAAKGALVDPLRRDSTATIAWLAVHLGHRVGLGRREHEWTGETNLLLTYHACLRAAQRKGVRTVPDLLTVLRDLWIAFETRPDGCRRLRLADGSVAVLELDRSDASRWIVKTILSPSP